MLVLKFASLDLNKFKIVGLVMSKLVLTLVGGTIVFRRSTRKKIGSKILPQFFSYK